jgi:hypothetical protein
LLFRPVMDEPMCPLRHSSASSSPLNEIAGSGCWAPRRETIIRHDL